MNELPILVLDVLAVLITGLTVFYIGAIPHRLSELGVAFTRSPTVLAVMPNGILLHFLSLLNTSFTLRLPTVNILSVPGFCWKPGAY